MTQTVYDYDSSAMVAGDENGETVVFGYESAGVAERYAAAAAASAVALASIELIVSNTGSARTEIQAALTALSSSGGIVTWRQPGVFTIDDELLIYSNTTFLLGPTTEVKMASGVTGNPSLIRNSTMPSVASYAIANTDIRIEGGIWNPNFAGNPSMSNNGGAGRGAVPQGCTGHVLMFGVRNLVLRGMKFRAAGGPSIQAIGEKIVIERPLPENPLTQHTNEMVHINGPSRWVEVRDVRCWSHDDIVAINAWDWRGSGPTVGDITDVVIERISMTAPESAANTQGAIRLLSGTRDGNVANVRRVLIQDIDGMNSGGNGAVGTDPTADPSGGGTNVPTGGVIEDVTIRNLNRVRLFNSTPAVRIAQTCKNWVIDGITLNNSNVGGAVVVASTGWIDKLHIKNQVGDKSTGVEGYVTAKGYIGKLIIENCTWTGGNNGTATLGSSAQGFVYVQGSAGWIDDLTFRGHQQIYGETSLYVENDTTGTAMRITIEGSKWDNVKHPFWLRRGAFTVRASNSQWKNMPNNMARFDGAAAAVTWDFAEKNCDFSTGASAPVYTNVSNVASIRHRGIDMGFDVASTTLRVAGDLARNTNAARSCGAGIVLVDATGATWKNLYTAATY